MTYQPNTQHKPPFADALYTDPVLYGYYRTKAQELRALDWPGTDEVLQLALTELNRLSGLATVFSCSGHTAEELKQMDKSYVAGNGYIAFAVRPHGLPVLVEYHRRLQEHLRSISATTVELETGILGMFPHVRQDVGPRCPHQWRTWTIRFQHGEDCRPERIRYMAALLYETALELRRELKDHSESECG